MRGARTRTISISLAVGAVCLGAALLLLVPGRDTTLALESTPVPLVPLSVGRPTVGPALVADSQPFTIAVTSDQRWYSGPGTYDTSQYYRGACEAIAAVGETAFMVSPGDIDEVAGVHWTITQTLGVTYTWYPVVGNHELPGNGTEDYTGANMDYLRAYDYGAVNPGPSGCVSTTFSFDYENVHLVILNEYCDTGGDAVTDGDMPDHLYNWLVADLAGTAQEHILILGHEPGYPQPDADNGRMRHEYDSLNENPDNRDRFWELMESEGVAAYICGHTHNYSVVNIGGVWQVDSGHARGLGDTGARSTFVLIQVNGPIVTYEAYRDDAAGGAYSAAHRGLLVGLPYSHLPLVMRSY